MSDGSKIRIASNRLSNGEFLHISDEYLIRPAEQDYWRLDATDGENLSVIRLVSDEHGTPQVFESPIDKTAARIKRVPTPYTPPKEWKSIAISPADDILLLDESGRTFLIIQKILALRPELRPAPRIREFLSLLIQTVQAMESSESDENWIREFASLANYLAQRGPISLDIKDPKYLNMEALLLRLYRQVTDVPRPKFDDIPQFALDELKTQNE